MALPVAGSTALLLTLYTRKGVDVSPNKNDNDRNPAGNSRRSGALDGHDLSLRWQHRFSRRDGRLLIDFPILGLIGAATEYRTSDCNCDEGNKNYKHCEHVHGGPLL